MISQMVALKIKNLTFSYGTSNVINNLSLNIPPGTTSALIGATGSGKTTLLKLMIGLLEPTTGQLETQGDVSYLMQEDTLLPWRNVWQHLTLILELQNQSINQESLYELLHIIGLKGAELKYPHQLSGGMKRRVSLAQAILRKHSLLLMDEPFSSLDVHIRGQMFDLLKVIQQKNQSTVLVVTHDYRDAITIADQILWLNNGTIQAQWPVSETVRNDPAKSGIFMHEIRQTTFEKPATFSYT